MKRIDAVIGRLSGVLSGRTVCLGIWALAVCSLGNSTPVMAQIAQILVPDSDYIESTKLLAPAPQDPNGTILNFLSDGNQQVTFSVPLEVTMFPGDFGWWGCPGNTEPWSASDPFKLVQFYSSQYCGDPWPTCSVELTLSRPTTTFGFEVQTYINFNPITVSFFNGPLLLGTISPPLSLGPACLGDGTVSLHPGGALLVAASVASPNAITRVVVSSPDFVQIGRIRYENMDEECLDVDVDVKPGDGENVIDLSKNKSIPVAILSDPNPLAGFDATTVNPSSVCFGHAGDPRQFGDCTAGSRVHIGDVNADLLPDLVLRFDTLATGIQPGDTHACLMGKSFSGVCIKGCAEVRPKVK